MKDKAINDLLKRMSDLEFEVERLEKRVEQEKRIVDIKDKDIVRLYERIDKAIEYINEYAWEEDIIGDMWTTTGEPVKDRYMRLEWDNCNDLLDILKGVDKE